jgi:hypothetical protein
MFYFLLFFSAFAFCFLFLVCGNVRKKKFALEDLTCKFRFLWKLWLVLKKKRDSLS